MDEASLKKLSADWSLIRQATRPTAGQDAWAHTDVGSVLVLLADQRDLWQALLGTVGFARSLGRSPASLAEDLWQDIEEPLEPGLTQDYIDYGAATFGLSAERLLPAARLMFSVAPPRLLVAAVNMAGRVQLCKNLCGTDQRCLRECLLKQDWDQVYDDPDGATL
ncbi:hypothetical protein G8A07_08320 [Roseateles sp. DAIF2]|uniref:hypothetical protein n=1 Tax=Roseateles sp. DAIF2 TaxID=2714952 RepID=UPI0018A30E37|nr:hypothetical protein [Roseateles sp. DAIF2]QPF72933.1 hypothetical protein G8A07_08320 [Roseateles sp. DAIF2]